MDRKRYTPFMGQKAWPHDCQKCEFLISIEDELPGAGKIGRMDIYASCDNSLGVSPILIRYGKEPEEYITTDGRSMSYDHLEDVFDHFFDLRYIRNKMRSEDDARLENVNIDELSKKG